MMQTFRSQKHKPRLIVVTLLISLSLLGGCSDWQHRATVIDWVDFVKTDDGMYMGQWNAVLRDSDTVTQEIVGTVNKKLDENVHNPNYSSKPGDAAFLNKGTKLYRVEGFEPEDVVAVQAEDQIGGYKLYVNEGYDGLPEQEFKAILRAMPSSVSVYTWEDNVQPLRIASGAEGQQLVELLQHSVYTPDYSSNTEQDPIYYQIVFDTGEPILYIFSLWDDGTNVMFRESYKAEDQIRSFLTP